jgi:hypothetical protein
MNYAKSAMQSLKYYKYLPAAQAQFGKLTAPL